MKKILNFFSEEIEDQEELDASKTEQDIRNYMLNDNKDIDDTQELGDIFVPTNKFEDTDEIKIEEPKVVEPKREGIRPEPQKMIRNKSAYEDTLNLKKSQSTEPNYRKNLKTYGIDKPVAKKVEEKKVESKKVEEPKRYKPRPFISPVHGIMDPEERQSFYEAHKTEKRAVVKETSYTSKIDQYEQIRNKAFNTGPIEIPVQDINPIEHDPLKDEFISDDEINVLEDVDFDFPIEHTQTDIDVEGKIFFDLVDDELEEKKPNYLFTTQEIIGDDIKVTTIEDIDRAYARDGIAFVNDDNRAVNPFENTDEIDRENLLSLIDKLEDY